MNTYSNHHRFKPAPNIEVAQELGLDKPKQ